jgi:hypothetical protein
MMNKEVLEQIQCLLSAVIDGYFGTGEIPGENAYALAVLARAYTDSLLGLEWGQEMIKDFEQNKGSVAIMHPFSDALDNQLIMLLGQREALSKSAVDRDHLMFLRKPPKLKLVPNI